MLCRCEICLGCYIPPTLGNSASSLRFAPPSLKSTPTLRDSASLLRFVPPSLKRTRGDALPMWDLPRVWHTSHYWGLSVLAEVCLTIAQENTQSRSDTIIAWPNSDLTRYCPLWALTRPARVCFWGTHTPQNESCQLRCGSPFINPTSLPCFANVGFA